MSKGGLESSADVLSLRQTFIFRMPTELQIVELTVDFPSKGVTRGMRGQSSSNLTLQAKAYDIEVVSADGATEILLASVRPNQIRPA